MYYTLRLALEEARIVQIDFTAAFDRVNHQGNSLQALRLGSWRICTVYSDIVSLRTKLPCPQGSVLASLHFGCDLASRSESVTVRVPEHISRAAAQRF